MSHREKKPRTKMVKTTAESGMLISLRRARQALGENRWPDLGEFCTLLYVIDQTLEGYDARQDLGIRPKRGRRLSARSHVQGLYMAEFYRACYGKTHSHKQAVEQVAETFDVSESAVMKAVQKFRRDSSTLPPSSAAAGLIAWDVRVLAAGKTSRKA